MKEAGFTIAQMRNAGLTVLQIQAGGFSISDLLSAGFSVSDLHNSGVSVADLNSGGVSIADLRSAGIADHLVFNGACTQSKTCTRPSGETEVEVEECSADHPTITLSLNTAKTRVVLEGKAVNSIRWTFLGRDGAIQFIRIGNSPDDMASLGNAEAVYVRDEGDNVVSTLSIPLADVFSNPTVITENNPGKAINIQLCPGM